ncbi:hypothetical protein ACWF82_31955 [Nocardia sp. NPDC055053]
MGTDGDDNGRGNQRPAAGFGPPVGDFGPPVDDEPTGFGGPLAAAPPPAPPGSIPEMGWRPAGPPASGPPPAASPFGAPVAGTPPVAPPPGPPTMPPRAPVQPPRNQSAPTSVFGDAVATPPPVPPQSPPRPAGDASPFGAPDPRVGAPSEDQTVRFTGEPPQRRDSSPFGDSVPVTSGRELTEVIRRGKPGPRAEAPAEPAPETVRMSTPEMVRQPAPETTRAPIAEEAKAEDKAWWNSPDESGGVPKPPDAGLSWADDPIARRLAPKTPVAPVSEKQETDQRMRWIIGGAAAAVLLVVALVLTIALVKRGGGDDPGPTAAPTTSAAIPGFSCTPMSEQAVTVGNGPGDTSTGAKAILGFQYAFYVDRSGTKVREYAAPDGVIAPAETIQGAIDAQIPVGSKHCVKMRETSPGQFDVELREWHPNGNLITYPQVITTTYTDGKWRVSSIATR